MLISCCELTTTNVCQGRRSRREKGGWEQHGVLERGWDPYGVFELLTVVVHGRHRQEKQPRKHHCSLELETCTRETNLERAKKKTCACPSPHSIEPTIEIKVPVLARRPL